MSSVDRAGEARVAASPPTELTSYVGRSDEEGEVRRLLGSTRLVTLTGPGGVGKTRLAARAMRDTACAFPDGVVFVELAQVRNGELVPNLVADRLGLHDLPDISARQHVIDHLRGRVLLLVLDNCEHLIDVCAGFTAELLAECPRVSVLTTSRQSLAVPGEQVVPVSPLPMPQAVELFLDRARAVWPTAVDDDQNTRATLTELCQRLDGLPLAIELAAARIRSLSPAQILDRLGSRFGLLTSAPRTAPQRQQTLRATLDWSYELCTPAERAVWTRTAVFAGSFDLDAATYVCGDAAIDPSSVLELIDSLLDKSILVRRDHGDVVRYQMLETLREYGQERLDQAGDRDRVARLHRNWFARLTAQADAEWFSDRQAHWITRLSRDHANLRAALDWSLSTPDEAGGALSMAGNPFEYWLLRGLPGEARTWLDRALAAAPPAHPDRVPALCICALHTLWLGDLNGMARRIDEAESLTATLDDELLRARILHVRSFAAMLTVQPETVDLAAETCAVLRAHGDLRAEMHPLFIHGVAIAYRDGDLPAARRSLRRMYELSTERGETFYRAMSLFGQAMVEVEFGEVRTATDAATEALRLDLHDSALHGRAYRVETLAWISDRQGDHLRAATLFGIADTFWNRIGTAPDFAVSVPHRKHIENTRSSLGDTRFDEAFAAGRALPDADAIRYALGEPATEPLPAAAAPPSPLTRRESEVAKLVAEGLTNRDIADELVIALRTVDTHVQHILTKLDFKTRAQIAAWIASHSRTP
ncbi:ATP-binding protein [Saccharopolyspora taberi]|uniref:ATP-binding protein n=1 Tax=Saccharopolyspora taberi TaxID=60895 RepID=UPI0031D99D57